MKRTPLVRRTPLSKPTKRMRASNPEKKARRRKAYAAHLRSAYFRALRLQAFARDGYRCTARVTLNLFLGMQGEARCPYYDETHTGLGLHADHLTYARFGAELLDDLATACAPCHMRRHALQGKKVGW